MNLRINLSIWGESGKVADLETTQALFDKFITPETVQTAQSLMAEAVERSLRKKKTFDGLPHYVTVTDSVSLQKRGLTHV